jgi:hypothetical protein
MDDIIGTKRTQLNTETIEKLGRNRAVSRLKMVVRVQIDFYTGMADCCCRSFPV